MSSFVVLSDTGSSYVIQPGLKLLILLRQPPDWWEYRLGPLFPPLCGCCLLALCRCIQLNISLQLYCFQILTVIHFAQPQRVSRDASPPMKYSSWRSIWRQFKGTSAPMVENIQYKHNTVYTEMPQTHPPDSCLTSLHCESLEMGNGWKTGSGQHWCTFSGRFRGLSLQQYLILLPRNQCHWRRIDGRILDNKAQGRFETCGLHIHSSSWDLWEGSSLFTWGAMPAMPETEAREGIVLCNARAWWSTFRCFKEAKMSMRQKGV